jgi:hypothetical protein
MTDEEEIKSILDGCLSKINSGEELTEEDFQNLRRELEPLVLRTIGKEKLDQIKGAVAAKFDAPSDHPEGVLCSKIPVDSGTVIVGSVVLTAGFVFAMIISNRYNKVKLNMRVRAFLLEAEVLNYEVGVELLNDGNQN